MRLIMYFYALIASAVVFRVCNAQQTLIELASTVGATECVKYLNSTGLEPAFTYNGNFTLFCPTNNAFNTLPMDVLAQLSSEPALLRQVMMFHAVDGAAFSSQLTDGMIINSLVQGADIRINIYTVNGNKIITVSGSAVTLADQVASNGVLHLIDRVMFPLSTDNAVQYLAKHPDLGTLLYSVAETTLPAVLQGDGPFTIFAPNNAAFDKLPAGYWSNLFNQNYQGYLDLLKYHVIPGVYYSKGLTTGKLQTLAGKSVQINTNNGVMVNNATVIKADQTIKNGVIHVIDHVLLFQSFIMPRGSRCILQ